MEIIVGLIMFSLGMTMASRMYRHCVHQYHPSYKASVQLQDLDG